MRRVRLIRRRMENSHMWVKICIIFTLILLCSSDVHFDQIDADILQDVARGNVQIFNERAMSLRVNTIGIKSIGKPDPKVGELLDLWDPKSLVNPEELGTYFEGDILNPISDIDVDRNGIIGDKFRWPKGIVHYKINGKFSDSQLKHIQKAMAEVEKYTCIQFRRYLGRAKDYISITSERTGCWTTVGRRGGEQKLNLQAPTCFYSFGTVIHELLHVLGFDHEQSRPDRDNHVTIVWNNIRSDSKSQFAKEKLNAFGIPYDYGSVLHYSAYAFSKNNKATIIPKKKGVTIGQRKEISWSDIYKIRAMYKCKGKNSEL